LILKSLGFNTFQTNLLTIPSFVIFIIQVRLLFNKTDFSSYFGRGWVRRLTVVYISVLELRSGDYHSSSPSKRFPTQPRLGFDLHSLLSSPHIHMSTPFKWHSNLATQILYAHARSHRHSTIWWYNSEISYPPTSIGMTINHIIVEETGLWLGSAVWIWCFMLWLRFTMSGGTILGIRFGIAGHLSNGRRIWKRQPIRGIRDWILGSLIKL
jgi:hypothetical protein